MTKAGKRFRHRVKWVGYPPLIDVAHHDPHQLLDLILASLSMCACRVITFKVHDICGLRLLLIILRNRDVTHLLAVLEIQLAAFDQIIRGSLVLDKAQGFIKMILFDLWSILLNQLLKSIELEIDGFLVIDASILGDERG